MASRIVLITGANSGIGFEMAKHLATAPEAFHVIMAGRAPAKIQSAIADLVAAGADQTVLTPLQLDVTDQASIRQAASTVGDRFGRLDVLVNNAGIAPNGPDTLAMFRNTFETNVFGAVLVSEAFRPLLMAAPAPWSVYVGSEVSSLGSLTDPGCYLHNTSSGSVAYRASKSALNMVAMHDQVAAEGSKLRIRIMCPGYVVSNLRGTADAERSGWGRAGDPANSANLLLSILRGERDGDAARLMRYNDVSPW